MHHCDEQGNTVHPTCENMGICIYRSMCAGTTKCSAGRLWCLHGISHRPYARTYRTIKSNVTSFTKLYHTKRRLSISHSINDTYILIYWKAIPQRSHSEFLRLCITNILSSKCQLIFQSKHGSSFQNCTLTCASPLKRSFFPQLVAQHT
jgi:hypothetical protein